MENKRLASLAQDEIEIEERRMIDSSIATVA